MDNKGSIEEVVGSLAVPKKNITPAENLEALILPERDITPIKA